MHPSHSLITLFSVPSIVFKNQFILAEVDLNWPVLPQVGFKVSQWEKWLTYVIHILIVTVLID